MTSAVKGNSDVGQELEDLKYVFEFIFVEMLNVGRLVLLLQ
jgi:hypothetical protein